MNSVSTALTGFGLNQLTILLFFQLILLIIFIKVEKLGKEIKFLGMPILLALLSGLGTYMLAGSALISQELTILLFLNSINAGIYFEIRNKSVPKYLLFTLGISSIASTFLLLHEYKIVMIGVAISLAYLGMLKFVMSHIPNQKLDFKDNILIFVAIGAAFGGNNVFWVIIISILLLFPILIFTALVDKSEILKYKPVTYFVLSCYVMLYLLSNNLFRLSFTLF